MRNKECIFPGSAFAESVFERVSRIKICKEAAVAVFRTHKAGFGVEKFLIVLCTLHKELIVLVPAENFCNLSCAPVCPANLKSTGNGKITSAGTRVVEVIVSVVNVIKTGSKPGFFRILTKSSLLHRLVRSFKVKIGVIMHPRFHDSRNSVMTYHNLCNAVCRVRRHGKPSAALIYLNKSIYHIGSAFGFNKICKCVSRSCGIP